jgi:hypothetical protein
MKKQNVEEIAQVTRNQAPSRKYTQSIVQRRQQPNNDWGSTINNKDPLTTKIYGIQEFSGTDR